MGRRGGRGDSSGGRGGSSGGQGNASGGQGDSSIPDEEWERFLRESEAGAAPAPAEPSARARQVAARLRDSPEPGAWRTGPAAEPRRARARKWGYAAAIVGSVAVLLFAMKPSLLTGGDPAPKPSEPLPAKALPAETAPPETAPPETAPPETAPPPVDPQAPTLAEPFRGSPASQWADGAEGVHVPGARATAWMSEAEVAQALVLAREFLVATNLDPKVLYGERPAKAITLINPHQPDMRRFVDRALRKPTEQDDPTYLISRFHPFKTKLVGEVVKTRGRLTYKKGSRGDLVVTADVTLVYPVTTVAEGDEEVLRVIVRRELTLSWDDPAKWQTAPGTFSVLDYRSEFTNTGCDTAPTGYIEPWFAATAEASGGPSAGAPTVDPYDRSAPMREPDAGCQAVSRT
ncbi:hypothetical protein G6045_39185 [Streptomyces sp. YC504]|uniref:Uncharacterized protein n=1 Tax=Streptomyces mesophilus TaxID=1775132 RepID=A0A6G4XXV2_9ACTN|nr:hypothetical protein [Streptomyces mesophilus]NGO81637.1 hypothetical protein [Streptomyces mesophilus]